MSGRRTSLQQFNTPPASCHAGLWLDKFLAEDREDDKAKRALVQAVSRIPEPAEYAAFFKRWEGGLQRAGVQVRRATVQTRMIVGLGAESVLETAIALHRTYGVPYIPGSALKGMTAAFARNRLEGWDQESEGYRTVFGTTDEMGYVSFFDALYVPQSAALPLVPDVMTPHHTAYTAGIGAPTDFDSPNPVSFLSATGTYLIALAGDPAWLDRVFTMMDHAFRESGIGAKTSSGYGRLTFEPPPHDAEHEQAESLLMAIRALRPHDVASRLGGFYTTWHNLALKPTLKQQVAQALVDKVREAGRERQSMDKPWYQDLLKTLNH